MEDKISNLPPHSVDGEKSVLGAMLLDEDAISRACEKLVPGDFYISFHQKIFEKMLRNFEKGQPSDLVTLTESLSQEEGFAQAGGATYLSELVDHVPTSANIEAYADIVRDKSVRRQLINSCNQINRDSHRPDKECSSLLDEAQQKIFDIAQQKLTGDFQPISSLIDPAIKTIEQLYENQSDVTGIKTGYDDLDIKTSGFQPSDLIILAARPAMGKTALALNIAANSAINNKKKVAIYSLEMSNSQLVFRMLCSEAKISASRARAGKLQKNEIPILFQAAQNLMDSSIFIDDTPGQTILDVRSKARRLKARQGLDMIIIDYLQLMNSPAHIDSREQQISSISRGLKSLARELDVPVLALSQLNRSVEQRTSKIPMLSDLRESGAIEQDADMVMFLHRESYYADKDSEESNSKLTNLIIAKQRKGPTGTVNLVFFDEYTRFEAFAYMAEAEY